MLTDDIDREDWQWIGAFDRVDWSRASIDGLSASDSSSSDLRLSKNGIGEGVKRSPKRIAETDRSSRLTVDAQDDCGNERPAHAKNKK